MWFLGRMRMGARIRVPKQSASNFFIGLFCGACLTMGGLGAAKAWESRINTGMLYTYRLSKWYNNPYTGQQIIQHDYVLASRVEVVGTCFRLWDGPHPVAAECGEVRIVRTADHLKANVEDVVNPPTRIRYDPVLDYVGSAR